MSILLLFGAGASFGNPDCEPAPPPLGAALFKELRSESEVAQNLDASTAAALEEDFERGMVAFYESKSKDVMPFLRDLGEFFAKYAPGPRNYYRGLADSARRSHQTVIWSTLNYDILLEIALADAGLVPVYTTSTSRNQATVLKLHGSCNFFGDSGMVLENVTWTNWQGDQIVSGNSITSLNREESLAYYGSDRSLPPVMAMYASGKRSPVTHDGIEFIQGMWRDHVAKASRIYIIGARVLPADQHIWNVLHRAPGRLYYVGLEPAQFEDWATGAAAESSHILADTFEAAAPVLSRVIGS